MAILTSTRLPHVARVVLTLNGATWELGAYPTMEAAILDRDPFQGETYWPAHNVGYYLGRMGIDRPMTMWESLKDTLRAVYSL